MPPRPHSLLTLLALTLTSAPPVTAQTAAYDAPPISYATAPTDTAVDRFSDDGPAPWGVSSLHDLARVLRVLHVPTSSQTLVFSQTSLQTHRIRPRTPRALYFSDDVYVGYVPGGELEVIAMDAALGPVFYSARLPTTPRAPRFVRDRGRCLSCHATHRTLDVPGFLMRSVFPAADGRVLTREGGFTSTCASPVQERWGGWYVTGMPGTWRHMGNQWVQDESRARELGSEPVAAWDDVAAQIQAAQYLRTDSDVAALLVLQHQVDVHNAMTKASMETRLALEHDRVMNDALGRPADHRTDVTTRRITRVADGLVRALLMAGEAPLPSPLDATSEFAADYSARGPHDARGRSLYQLDLATRTYRYRCSPLIYSATFAALPSEVATLVHRRLATLLHAADPVAGFESFTKQERRAVRDILLATLPNSRTWLTPR